jgi:hypothetical protein
MSNDDRFLQGISVHLPSFGFPETEEAEAAGKQFDSFTDTLCQAPGRMSLYSTFDTDYIDCIPYYDSILEKVSEEDIDEENGDEVGFDKDFQKVVDGHKLPERNRKAQKCDYTKHKLFNQEIQPGKNPGTETPQSRQQKKKEKEEARIRVEGERQRVEEERVGQEEEKELSEAGMNPNGPEPGAGSFGGVVGVIPPEQAGQPVAVEETVQNLEELQSQPAPTTVQPTEPAESTEEPDRRIIDRRSKRQLQREGDQKPAKNVLGRREQLRAAGDHCVDRLTISHHVEHSAREVCEMKYSWGPDFVSIIEGLYCDMCERELYPLCAHKHQQDCFDIEGMVLRGKESLWQRVKSYIDIQVWRA